LGNQKVFFLNDLEDKLIIFMIKKNKCYNSDTGNASALPRICERLFHLAGSMTVGTPSNVLLTKCHY